MKCSIESDCLAYQRQHIAAIYTNEPCPTYYFTMLSISRFSNTAPYVSIFSTLSYCADVLMTRCSNWCPQYALIRKNPVIRTVAWSGMTEANVVIYSLDFDSA